MTTFIGLDFETYGAVDLNKHGLYRYMKDPSFKPLLGSTAINVPTSGIEHVRFDFINNGWRTEAHSLRDMIGDSLIVSHNAIFEDMVLRHLGLEFPAARFVDSAVVARAAGAAGKLEAAAPQLLNVEKIAAGRDLIKTFSIPGKYQADNGNDEFDPQVIDDNPLKWEEFGIYCELDSELGLRIAHNHIDSLSAVELTYQAVTMRMNHTGWPVDMDLVEEMQRRYYENLEETETWFRARCNAPDLNLHSLKQMKEWCEERGVRANSFAEKQVAALATRLNKKLYSIRASDPKYNGYLEVLELLKTKQILGGSSLKKLQVLRDTASLDEGGGWRLRDQYLHCGAGQTLRTTGRGVQMQNLKRLSTSVHIDGVESLMDPSVSWDNDKLAENIRQMFTSSHPQGQLLVGDFKSVESRGLAYLAGEQWKLDAYRRGEEVYKVQAGKIFGIPADVVTYDQRQLGKVGELSCGYQAGAGAVKDFAAKMGTDLVEAEAAKLVRDWRDANPATVAFWYRLDDMLHEVVEGQRAAALYHLTDGMALRILEIPTPASLMLQHSGAQSIMVSVTTATGKILLKRVFHGCYIRGRNICYYKPSDRKTGDLWKQDYVDPKTKQRRFYEIYGGKLAGILTQSFCRELFMRCLLKVEEWAQDLNQLQVIGQFHDEIVVDWVPGVLNLATAKSGLAVLMSDPGPAVSFPLEASVKADYRYTK